MRYYRLYFMNAGTGHIDRFAEFEAPTDEAAEGLAAEHEGEQPLELWCLNRKVRRFEPAPALRTAAATPR